MAAVTINTSDGSRVFTPSWIDTANIQHDGMPPGYSNPTYSADDGGALVTLLPLNLPAQSVRVTMVGPTGTFNLTETSTKAGSPTLTGFTTVTIDGPIPASLAPQLQPLS